MLFLFGMSLASQGTLESVVHVKPSRKLCSDVLLSMKKVGLVPATLACRCCLLPILLS